MAWNVAGPLDHEQVICGVDFFCKTGKRIRRVGYYVRLAEEAPELRQEFKLLAIFAPKTPPSAFRFPVLKVQCAPKPTTTRTRHG
jgi:hypothetical protein